MIKINDLKELRRKKFDINLILLNPKMPKISFKSKFYYTKLKKKNGQTKVWNTIGFWSLVSRTRLRESTGRPASKDLE